MLDREQGGLRRPTLSSSPPSRKGGLEPVAPLDHDRALVEKLLQAEVEKVGAGLEAVEVDVGQLNAPRVHPHQLEGGAGHMRRRSGATRQAADERCLAGAEVAFEKQQIAQPKPAAEILAGRLGFGG